MTQFSCLNWDSENSVQAGQDDREGQTGRLCSGWRIAKAQLLYHRNTFFVFVKTLVTGSPTLRDSVLSSPTPAPTLPE